MALSHWLVVLTLLTTWDCIQSVKAQSDGPQAANVRCDCRADSLPAGTPQPESSTDDNSLADGPPADSSSGADNVPADSCPADNAASADTLPAADCSPADSSPTVSSSDSPGVDSLPAGYCPPECSPDESFVADSSPVDNFPGRSSPADISPALDNSPADSSTAISTTDPPAVFVFGDSLVDTRNNNHIQTQENANVLLYGIDLPAGPTGQFCNARTVADILCDILGVPYPPPFLDPQTNGSRILRGVSYASRAGGLLDATPAGANFLNRVSMNQQISSFEGSTLPQLEALLGTDTATTLMASSLVAIIMGSSDSSLLLDSVQTQYTAAQLNVRMINSLRRQLMELYGFGFRMFFVCGIGPLGCIPHQLAISEQPNCVSLANAQAQNFNALVKSTLQHLNNKLADATFMFGDSSNSLRSKYGFPMVNGGLCGRGTYRAQILCQPTAAAVCSREEYVFWDEYHPPEADDPGQAIQADAAQQYKIRIGGPKAVTPIMRAPRNVTKTASSIICYT